MSRKSVSRATPQAPLAQLARRIKTRTARVGVLGLGYVGLPLAVEFANEGFRVTGIDLDLRRVAGVNRGRSGSHGQLIHSPTAVKPDVTIGFATSAQ